MFVFAAAKVFKDRCAKTAEPGLEVKRLLKFYFSADGVDRAIDNLILKKACSPCCDAWGGAESVLKLVGEKKLLNGLWAYLDGALSALAEGEKNLLKEYSAMRCGTKSLTKERRCGINNALAKFRRRARRLESFEAEMRLVGKYYCLLC